MKKIFIVIILSIVSCSNRNLLKETPIIVPRTINLSELNYLQNTLDKNNIVLLDLRSKKQYDKGAISNAFSLPYQYVLSITNTFVNNNYRFIFYDKEDVSYFRIRNKLHKLNITNFYLLEGGYKNWQRIQLSNN